MPSLTLSEGRARAALVSDASYAVHLDLTGADAGAPRFGSRTTVQSPRPARRRSSS